MHSSQILVRLGASIVCAAGIATATYFLEDNYDEQSFFSEFNFFEGPDPTGGFVDYNSQASANVSGLAGYANGAVYLGVDYQTMNPSSGRGSVRVTSNKAYTHGLFIADIAHMPGSICGVWPAFWTFGPNWPTSGEIDIIEGVSRQSTNIITLHTSPGCTVSGSGSLNTSTLGSTDCSDNNSVTGCSYGTVNRQGYGSGFNAIGGGIYGMEWTSEAIQVWFFPRTAIPSDITSGVPNSSGWGTPTASFSGSGCDIDSYFMNHNIVFDTTFCGQWAGQVWSSSTCAPLASTCNAYVAANPAAFMDAYWIINSVKVYQDLSVSKRHAALTPAPFTA